MEGSKQPREGDAEQPTRSRRRRGGSAWRQFRWKLHLAVRNRARLREAAQWHQEHVDARENRATALPVEEKLEWPGFWLTELYAPSHAPALVSGVEGLARGGGGMFLSSARDMSEWVTEARSWTGGFHNLGFFAQPGRFLGHDQRVDLPREFVFAQASLRQIAPGITILVAQFALDEAHRGCLSRAMRETFASKAEAHKPRGSYSVLQPEQQKQDRIRELREHYRSLARTWLSGRLPGLFAARDAAQAPTWDVLLTQSAQLFTEESSADDRWRDTLGFGRVLDRWTSEKLPGLHLLAPTFGDRSGVAPTFAGTEQEVLQLLEDEHTGNDTNSLMQVLNSHLADVLALWTMQQALHVHERQFTVIRDELAAPPGWRGTGRRLRRLRGEVMPLAFDLETLHEASQNAKALEMHFRYSDADFAADTVEIAGKTLRPRSSKPLMQHLAAVIQDRGARVASQGREITAALQVQAELLFASTNVRLQWLVLTLTLLVGAAGVYATLSAG